VGKPKVHSLLARGSPPGKGADVYGRDLPGAYCHLDGKGTGLRLGNARSTANAKAGSSMFTFSHRFCPFSHLLMLSGGLSALFTSGSLQYSRTNERAVFLRAHCCETVAGSAGAALSPCLPAWQTSIDCARCCSSMAGRQ